ncbi:unnamed protein product [Anisakis simplex]|uniref:long-chain-fatty-acid--CoA ligase n=1 Tax=Anisakis simplex TaxID=6269 RepID=A0A0M3JWG6_ANISI|nr:unnamed protein product [Anisakis simplex]
MNEVKTEQKNTDKDAVMADETVSDAMTLASIMIRFTSAIFKASDFCAISFAISDAVSYFPMKLFTKSNRVVRDAEKVKAVQLIPGDPYSPWRWTGNALVDTIFPGCDTLAKVWDEVVRRYADLDCFGVREVLSVSKDVQPDGRVFEKMELGDYQWTTFKEVDKSVRALAKGLIKNAQLKPKSHVAIYSETREEWMVTALACYKCNFPIVTIYATLGEEALKHAIRECDTDVIFTTATLLPKCFKVIEALSECPSISMIVYYSAQDPEAITKVPMSAAESSNVRMLPFADLIEIGEQIDESDINMTDYTAQADDLALFMYTSGTTANPKGVMISNRNLIAATAGQDACIDIKASDVYIGYLPLAHIIEVCCQLVILTHGCKIGFSSPLTLFDGAAKLKDGQKGDSSVLRPTLMSAVPAVFDRIVKGVLSKIAQASPMKQELFRLCYERKKSHYEQGRSCPILDRLIFNKIRALLGGRMREMLSGGAPLNPETQRFMQICFCPIIQAYGLTETCGGGTICDLDDISTDMAGVPIRCCDIMLREWKEGGYSPLNKTPQGEVLIGGANIALGYYKNEAKTAEDFFELNGRRWFVTGDIGEFRSDGSLTIIDRKKDLVKLSHGEYVSLARVETALRDNKYVDNICVYGEPVKDYVIAFIVPNVQSLTALAKKHGIVDDDIEMLCKDDRIISDVLDALQKHVKGKLSRWETPRKIHLCSEVWLQADGLLTEALKLKRRAIKEKYQSVISAIYQ